MPNSFDGLLDIALTRKTQFAQTERTAAQNFGFQTITEKYALAGSYLAPRPHQCLPAVGIEPPHQEHFDFRLQMLPARRAFPASPGGVRPDTGAMAEEARGNHFRVVHDQKLVASQPFGQFPDPTVLPRTRMAVQQHHPGGVALGERDFRDQFCGQGIIEIT